MQQLGGPHNGIGEVYHGKSYLDGLSEQTSIVSGLDHVTFWIISLSN